MSDLIELLETSFFQVGIWVGLSCLVLGWLLILAVRRRQPLPVAGVLIGGGTLLALWILEEPIGTEIWAVIVILLGTLTARLVRGPAWVTPVAALPGAVWLAMGTDITELGWVRLSIVVLVPVVGYLIDDFEKRYSSFGLGVIFFVLAILGVFFAVPDTEWARTLVAVAVPVTFLAWPMVGASLGTEGSYVAVAVFLIVTSQGGGPRPASIVGGIAGLGLLLIEPVLIVVRPSVIRLTTWLKRNWVGAVLAAIPQFVLVAICSRVAARFTSVIPAIAVVIAVYVAVIAVGLSAVARDPEDTTTSRYG